MIVVIVLSLIAVVGGQMNQHRCTSRGNYIRNSTYTANLYALLNGLHSNMSNNGYYTASIGTANALALCRADRTLDQCHQCIAAAVPQLLMACADQTQGALWTEFCLVRYSNQPINKTGASDDGGTIMFSTTTVSGHNYFREDIMGLIAGLIVQAAKGSFQLKVGVGTKPTSNGESTVYALLQCTPDLLSEDCRQCLANISTSYSFVTIIKQGAVMLDSNCIMRYELYPFYNQTRLRQLRLLPPSPADTKKVVMITVPIGVCIAMVACAVIFLRKRMKRPSSHQIIEITDEINTVESLQYEFAQIRAATANFDDSNKLGQGGFGSVYRGRLLEGQEIAVKRLSQNSGQGNTEFKNEVLLVAGLQHRNLVRLLGFSQEGAERLLVYELVQNASLDQFIFDSVKRSHLDWDTRHKIIGGVARGLLYLHEDSRLRIIHRDLKASNVLLDGDMNPKIADFGMARLSRRDEIQGNTNKIVGTYGYMAPEYAMHGEFSIKSDVFSFGVLVLEIISGRKNNVIRHGDTVENLLTITWENWKRGAAAETIDPVWRNRGTSLGEMLKCIHIGLLCVEENAAKTPTMSSVLHMLGASSASTFQRPSQPAFYMATRFDPNNFIQQSDSGAAMVEGCSQNEMSATELYPR